MGSTEIKNATLKRADVGAQTRRKILWRIAPFVFLLYIIAFLDRVNVGFAALQLPADLGFSAKTIGIGKGIFFIGYLFLSIPGSLLFEKGNARNLISLCMISFGTIAVIMGFMQTENQFYTLRFLLGVAEAGFFPGIIVFLSHWFRNEDRATAMALFLAAVPISFVIGSPLSGQIMTHITWFDLAGWRWLFILEGLPALLLGIGTLFYLADRPQQAKWLSAEQRDWITTELEHEKKATEAERKYTILEALKHREVLILSFAYFFIMTTGYGFLFWLPSIIKNLSGYSDLTVTFVVTLPHFIGLIAILLLGWSSDRTGERRWHTAASMLIAGIGFALTAITLNNFTLAALSLCFAAIGIYGYLPCFWALPTMFLTTSAAAAAIGLINALGNLGGFAGPFIIGTVKETTGSFSHGVIAMAVSAFIAAGLILLLRKMRVKGKITVGH